MISPSSTNPAALEIEAKFLLFEKGQDFRVLSEAPVLGDSRALRQCVREKGEAILQGYFDKSQFAEVIGALGLVIPFTPKEIRLRAYRGEWLLTTKGEGGLARNELEVPIGRDFFDRWWPLTAGRRVAKIRWQTVLEGRLLEIDDYQDRDLLTAEITLASAEERQTVPKIGKDVTDDTHYKNKNLAK